MIIYSKNEIVNVSVGFRVCSRYCDEEYVGRSDLLTYRLSVLRLGYYTGLRMAY
jgi:hypothetical protein